MGLSLNCELEDLSGAGKVGGKDFFEGHLLLGVSLKSLGLSSPLNDQ
jgi:hypothetical protein